MPTTENTVYVVEQHILSGEPRITEYVLIKHNDNSITVKEFGKAKVIKKAPGRFFLFSVKELKIHLQAYARSEIKEAKRLIAFYKARLKDRSWRYSKVDPNPLAIIRGPIEL
jgi:hypothetical protein